MTEKLSNLQERYNIKHVYKIHTFKISYHYYKNLHTTQGIVCQTNWPPKQFSKKRIVENGSTDIEDGSEYILHLCVYQSTRVYINRLRHSKGDTIKETRQRKNTRQTVFGILRGKYREKKVWQREEKIQILHVIVKDMKTWIPSPESFLPCYNGEFEKEKLMTKQRLK